MPPLPLTRAGSKSHLTCAPKTRLGLLNWNHLGSCYLLQISLPRPNAYPQHHMFLFFPSEYRCAGPQKELWFYQHQRDSYIPHNWLLRNVTMLFNWFSSLARKGRGHDWMNKWKRLDMLSLVPHWRLLFMNAFDGLGFCFFPKQTFSSFRLICWCWINSLQDRESQN